MAVAKHTDAIECAGVRQASAAGSPLRAGSEAAELGSGILSATGRRDASNSLAAHRWSRRLIAWVFRRGVRLARGGRTTQALRIMRRLAHLAPDLGFVQLSLARLASSLGDMETARARHARRAGHGISKGTPVSLPRGGPPATPPRARLGGGVPRVREPGLPGFLACLAADRRA